MSGEASKAIDKSVLWGGGRSPYSVSYGKMMMWFFLISDALTFSGLLIALGFAKVVHADEWPVGEKVFEALPFLGKGFPLVYVALMTFLLIISSVTMKSAITPSLNGLMALILPGVLPSIVFASSPTARTVFFPP